MWPMTIACPCFMGIAWLICKGNPTLPLPSSAAFFLLGTRRGFGLVLSPSLDSSCLLKLPNHTEEAQQVLGEDDLTQYTVICEGLRPEPRVSGLISNPSHLSPQSVKA